MAVPWLQNPLINAIGGLCLIMLTELDECPLNTEPVLLMYHHNPRLEGVSRANKCNYALTTLILPYFQMWFDPVITASINTVKESEAGEIKT